MRIVQACSLSVFLVEVGILERRTEGGRWTMMDNVYRQAGNRCLTLYAGFQTVPRR
jgi:hypothetical protein